MLLGVTQIFLFTLYNERTRENKEKEGEKKRERKRKQKSARKCTFLSLPRKTIIHHYLDPVLPSLHTHIHRQESTQHKQVKFSGTKQHFAIAHSPWSGKRQNEEKKAKKKELRKEEGTLKTALATDLSIPGIRKFFCFKRYLLIFGFVVIHISTLSDFYLLKSISFYLDFIFSDAVYNPLLEIFLSYFILSTYIVFWITIVSLSLYSRFLDPCISRYFCAANLYFLIPLQGFNARLLSLSIDRILKRKKGMACAFRRKLPPSDQHWRFCVSVSPPCSLHVLLSFLCILLPGRKQGDSGFPPNQTQVFPSTDRERPILRSLFLNVDFLLSYELAENNGRDSECLLSRC